MYILFCYQLTYTLIVINESVPSLIVKYLSKQIHAHRICTYWCFIGSGMTLVYSSYFSPDRIRNKVVYDIVSSRLSLFYMWIINL